MEGVLTRTEFREGVFARDQHKCVVCGKEAVDAHHIIDRKCFTDGGYYLDNGVSLCADHHWDAEKGNISCDELRKYAGITTVRIPFHFDSQYKYDKWGEIVIELSKEDFDKFVKEIK